jgi:tRNA ligase
LCDDSFEEHVLPYSPENTGLHLHGLNSCSKDFHTQPPDAVDDFAREWGFIVTRSTVLESIPAVKDFTEEIGRAGSWNGEPLEGFVVRTQVTDPPTKGKVSPAQSPYAPGTDFFFKIKFDEPYMMYRDWRELTKALLSQKGPLNSGRLSKKRMQRPESQVYVKWVIQEIKRDRKQFDGYLANHGIVATRERFQAWFSTQQGNHELELAEAAPEGSGLDDRSKREFGKTIIFPVAVPGCGKTTVAVALAHLYGFGHVQSDNIQQGKKAGPNFIKNVINLLDKHDVVIADKYAFPATTHLRFFSVLKYRNNHLKQHRQALHEAIVNFFPPVRLLALNWSLNQPLATIHRICGDRIAARGQNHQNLLADTSLLRAHEDVVWQFLKNTEDLADSEADVVIEMDVDDTPDQALSRAIDACVDVLGVSRPSEEEFSEALEIGLGYKPELGKVTNKNKMSEQEKPEKTKGPRYYALLPEIDLNELLSKQLTQESAPASASAFFDDLVHKKRVATRPHITLVHSKSITDEKDVWDATSALACRESQPRFSFRISHLLWNDRVMALVVDNVAISLEVPDNEAAGAEWLLHLPEYAKERLHITVGTREEAVNPFEAKALVQQWKQQNTTGIEAWPLSGHVFAEGRVRGMFS